MLYPLSYGGMPALSAGSATLAKFAGQYVAAPCRTPVSRILSGVVRRAGSRWLALASTLAVLVAGCVAQAPPAPAELREAEPPWPAPRDGVSYFEAAGVQSSRLDDTTDQRILELTLTIDAEPVPVAGNIGLDLPRALQAPVHTHDQSGTLWLEGAGAREVTLGQFFTIWGVRFTDDCLGAACGSLSVEADGTPVPEPSDLVLASVAERVSVAVVTAR